MIEFRHFRNCDSPGIVDLWRRQPPLDGRLHVMTTGILEHYVLAKPYFDPAGLILALDGEEVVGMIHAGFGSNDDGDALSYELGAICMLLLGPNLQEADRVAVELVTRAEAYLKEQGAKVFYGGAVYPMNSFYLGLYGGSELPGVLAGDNVMLESLQSHGYEPIDEVVILERDLTAFRPKVDRKTQQVRRKFHIEATFDPPVKTWWDACSYGLTDRTSFVLRAPGDDRPACHAAFWDMEPLASGWGTQAVGMIDVATDEARRRQGLATFLIGEALKQLQGYGLSKCQVQAMRHNEAALGLYEKLGFEEVDFGHVLRKTAVS